ncbi:phage/plasmid primase, P4 family [Apilactobacillus micheneri]|uniref:phage/plasmid primase, P4 family n=1 Tax=Apilactobacillus micheneri TaxID=1899430 RepID=UPI0015E86462|nr:phage/plasmid primase, P4 family [Apilactobacillus micheneri]
MTNWEYIQVLSNKGICMYPLIKGTKKPAIKDMLNQATNDLKQLEEWFQPTGDGEIAHDVAINPSKSNLLVIDVDNHKATMDGAKWISEKDLAGCKMQATISEITPNKGLHYFYVNDLDIDIPTNLTLDNKNAVEVKTTSTIIYPSAGYGSTRDGSIIDHDIGKMPEWLKESIKTSIKSNKKTKPITYNATNLNASNWLIDLADAFIHGIDKGNRNVQMAKILGKLFYTGADNDQVWEWFNYINNNYVNPPLKANELQGIFKSIAKRDHNIIKIDERSDIAKAKRAANKFMKQSRDGKLSYLAGAKIMLKYFYFTRFSIDEGERIAIYVNNKESPQYGLYTRNYDYIKRIINAINPHYPSKGIHEVLEKLEMMVVNVKKPEHTKNLIPVGNGIFNLKTKKLDDYTPEHVFSSKVNTNYDPKYKEVQNIPKIDDWTLDDWLMNLSKDEQGNNDDQVFQLLWQVLADSLNGNYTRRKAILLNSEHGNSGKGTFQSLITNLVGEHNVATLKVNEFSERFAMSRLMGKSVCIGDDNPNGYIRDSSNFNSVITGDVVNIEYKGKDSFTTQLTPTVIQSFNGLPHFSNKGGTYRRMMIVPFRQRYKGNSDNWKIKDVYLKRQDVLEYTLFKALNVYSDFDKFITPDISRNALNDFEKENDPIKEFVDEEFNQWEINKISTQAVYTAYTRYCSENGYSATSRSKFVREVQISLPQYKKSAVRIPNGEYQELMDKIHDKPIQLLKGIDMGCHGNPIQCFYRM